MRTGLYAAAVSISVLGATAALAQSLQPSISSSWDDMRLAQKDCLARAQQVFERMRFSRIENVGNSVFADLGDFQLAFRCVSEKQMFYVYGGGPGDQDRRLDSLITDLKAEFNRR
jgi:hypothetical protein